MSLRIGVDIGGTKMLVLTEQNGRFQTARFATGPHFTGADADAVIQGILESLPAPPDTLGIAVPGLVDHGSQVIACDVLPRLVGWQPRLPADQPHVLLNDAEAALIGATGSEPYRNIGVVVIGTAIGAAFLVDGSPLRGASNWAGELGSLPLPAPGGVATLDRLAGGASILEALAGRDPESPEGRTVIEQAGFYLGLGLAAVINLLNPERLVLGGGALRWPGYYQAAVRAAREHTLPDLWRACTLEASPRADTLVAYGALLAASPRPAPDPAATGEP